MNIVHFFSRRASWHDQAEALAIMIGYVIGVGMFGLPFLTVRAGLVSFLLLLAGIGFVQYFLHLMYASLILENGGKRRIPGLAGEYLGRGGQRIAFAAQLIGNTGALLAYLILTGVFLQRLLGPVLGGSEFAYSTGAFLFCSLVVLFGVRSIGKSELVLSFLLLFVVILISLKGAPIIEPGNFAAADWRMFLLPFGAMLFALDGSGSIPIFTQLIGKDRKAVRDVIRLGTFIPAIVIFLFTVTVVGVSGSATTPDALTGLGKSMDGLIPLALVFGIICMLTSFFGVAEAVKEMLERDYKASKPVSFLAACVLPYLLFVFGFKDFISVISFVGAVSGGITAIMLIQIFLEMEKRQRNLDLFNRKPGKVLMYLLAGVFAFGIFYELYFFFV
jgi:tyrosine-specific transport protein